MDSRGILYRHLTTTRLLVIDDDPRFARQVAMALDRAADVRTVTRGSDVLTCVRAWAPDVVLLDLLLHDADGFALLERLLSLESAPRPFVLCVGDGPGAVARLSLEPGWPVGMLPRSASPAQLRSAVLGAARRGGVRLAPAATPAPA